MFISRSFWRKVVATVGAAVGFVFVYETTTRDSRFAARPPLVAQALAAARSGSPLPFTATAYCKGETTASGVVVRTGIAAGDPTLLPVGTVVRIDTADDRYDGVWTIMDTGPAVQGRTVDLYLWSCRDALEFGRQPITLSVLRLGWNPQNSDAGRVDSLFKQREMRRVDLPIGPKAIDPTDTFIQPLTPSVVPASNPIPVAPPPPPPPPPSDSSVL
jgi:3D (Asp-Asp-Asp) domain-containing protein